MMRLEISRTCTTCGRKQDVENIVETRFAVVEGEVAELYGYISVHHDPEYRIERMNRTVTDGLRAYCSDCEGGTKHALDWQLYDDDPPFPLSLFPTSVFPYVEVRTPQCRKCDKITPVPDNIEDKDELKEYFEERCELLESFIEWGLPPVAFCKKCSEVTEHFIPTTMLKVPYVDD